MKKIGTKILNYDTFVQTTNSSFFANYSVTSLTYFEAVIVKFFSQLDKKSKSKLYILTSNYTTLMSSVKLFTNTVKLGYI
jgi:hypothetical protein